MAITPTPFARLLTGDAGVAANNAAIDAGTAKANPVLFGGAKATARDLGGGLRGTGYGPGQTEVISPGYGGANPALLAMQSLRDAGLAPEQATNAVVGAGTSNVNETKAALLPAESAAANALSGQQARLVGQQAQYFGSTALSENAARAAQARAVGITADVLKYNGLDQPAVDNPQQARTQREAALLAQLPADHRSFYRLGDDNQSLVPRWFTPTAP